MDYYLGVNLVFDPCFNQAQTFRSLFVGAIREPPENPKGWVPWPLVGHALNNKR